MPPCLDIYIVTERSKANLEQFMSKYADVSDDQLRADYEIYLTDTEEFIATGSLAATLEYGLADNKRKFALYLNSKPNNMRPMIYFGSDGCLVLGLSVEESTNNGSPNDAEAESVLAQLKIEFGATKGLIAFELPPADADEELADIVI